MLLVKNGKLKRFETVGRASEEQPRTGFRIFTE